MKKPQKAIIVFFVLVVVLLNFIYARAQSSSFEKDGTLNFDNPGAIANAIENNQISVDRLFKEGTMDKVESVFNRGSMPVQSKILSYYASTSISVNGQIKAFDNGIIKTDVADLNLNDFKNFDGTISINADGSITIVPGTSILIQIDNSKVTSLNQFDIRGNANERHITGSDILIKNAEKVTLKKGTIVIKDGQYTLQEYSSAEFLQTTINTQNTKVDLGFNSGKNSYVVSQQSRGILLAGKEYSVKFSQNSPYEFVDVNGANIDVINGELRFTFNNKEIMLNANLGRGVKNMILKNMQGNHKVGVARDGSFVAYSNPKLERVGSYKRTLFIVHAYDAQLELDTKELKNDYRILVDNFENPHENKDFQNFVAQHSDFIRLRIFPKVTYSQTADEIKAESQKEIERSGVAYTKLQDGIRIMDEELQSQRELYENFLISLGGSQDGSELVFTIDNNRAFIEYYPNKNDRTNKRIVEFPNANFLRKVLLPVWVTEKNNVEDMPAKLICGTIKSQDSC